MHDIIIIGAGPAGLTAAIYARRAAKKVLVFEAKTYGGQIVNATKIENYPAEPHISGAEFAKKLYNQAKDLGTEFVFERVEKIEDGEAKKVITEDETYMAKAIIIATGTGDRRLKLKNEDKLIGRGISYCVTCDGALYKDKDVAIVGGGNSAIYGALYLSNLAKKVYLIHHNENFRAEQVVIDKLKSKDNIEIILDTSVTKLNGENKLESIEITNNDGSVKTLKIDGLFVAIGHTPETEEFKDLLDLDEKGYAESSENCTTKTPGIFVAGDNREKELRQLVTATSDGAIAATNAIKYLNSSK